MNQIYADHEIAFTVMVGAGIALCLVVILLVRATWHWYGFTMTNAATSQNQGEVANLQALLRLRDVLRQTSPQLAQAFQVLVLSSEPPRTATEDSEQEVSIKWLPAERKEELRKLALAAFDLRIGGIKDLEAFITLLEATRQALKLHWRELPSETRQQLAVVCQAILDLFSGVTGGQVRVPLEDVSNKSNWLSRFPRYFRTLWTLTSQPGRTFNHLGRLTVVLPRFARTVQRLNDQDKNLADFQSMLAEDNWYSTEQVEQNAGLIAWLRERRQKAALLTDEEQEEAREEFGRITASLDSQREPENKLFSDN